MIIYRQGYARNKPQNYCCINRTKTAYIISILIRISMQVMFYGYSLGQGYDYDVQYLLITSAVSVAS